MPARFSEIPGAALSAVLQATCSVILFALMVAVFLISVPLAVVYRLRANFRLHIRLPLPDTHAKKKAVRRNRTPREASNEALRALERIRRDVAARYADGGTRTGEREEGGARRP